MTLGGDLWRRSVAARAEPAGDALARRSLMVVAPHPDDETLGCGALVARARAHGAPVTVVVAADGRHSTASTVLTPDALAELRAAELRSACESLGVTDLCHLRLPDGALSTEEETLAGKIGGLLHERRPDVVLVPSERDDHPDHRAVNRAAMRALRGSRHPCLVLAYPIWAWYRGPWFLDAPLARRPALCAWAAGQVASRAWLRVPSGPYLAAKAAALRAHASQTTNLTGEPSWSYLPADFVSLFLRPVEVFLRVSR